MSKPAWTFRSGVLLALISVSLFLVPIPGEAKNPDLSYWTLNLSESAPTQLGETDSAQEIEVVGSTVHVMWITHDKDIWARYKIFYRRSTDNGQTWEAKKLISASDSGLVTDNTYKRMVVTDNTVHIAVSYASDEGSGLHGVLGYFRSIDNGASFEPIRVLFSAAVSWWVYDVRVAASNGKLTIGFRNQCNWQVNNEYYVRNSDDGGANFTELRTVYSTTIGNSWLVSDLQRVGDNIYVLYTDSNFTAVLPYSNLYIASSANAGTNFVSRLISVPSSNGKHRTGTLQDYHYVPKIAGVDNTVSVIWNGLDGADVHSVFTCQSTDSGGSFGAAVNLTRDVIPAGKALQAGQETLAAQGSYVYSLFLSTASNVYFRRSTDGGVTFLDLKELTSATAPYINGGWWPVIKTDPTVASGAKVHVFWARPTYVYSQDGGATFTKPELVSPYFSYSNTGAARPQMAIGLDGKVHWTIEGQYYTPSFGFGDFDIFYRGLSPAPAPSGANNGLHLVSNTNDARFDNMQVRASSDLNFTTQMTGEVWVRPYAGGQTTGDNLGVQPIFYKLEQGYNRAYSLETWGVHGGGLRKAAVRITTTANNTTANFWLNSSTLVPDNVWSHLAFTYDAAGGDNNLKLYLNGKLIAQQSASGTLATGDGLFFTGYYGIWDVAELRLWNVVRTQAQIAATMKRPLAGSEPGLAAYYTFKNTTKDTGHGNDGILMYMEQYIQQTIFSAGAVPAINFLLLLD